MNKNFLARIAAVACGVLLSFTALAAGGGDGPVPVVDDGRRCRHRRRQCARGRGTGAGAATGMAGSGSVAATGGVAVAVVVHGLRRGGGAGVVAAPMRAACLASGRLHRRRPGFRSHRVRLQRRTRHQGQGEQAQTQEAEQHHRGGVTGRSWRACHGKPAAARLQRGPCAGGKPALHTLEPIQGQANAGCPAARPSGVDAIVRRHLGGQPGAQ